MGDPSNPTGKEPPINENIKPAMASSSDFKALYRKLERTLDRIERIDDASKMLESVVQILIQEYREDLGFEAGRIYMRDESDFYLCCSILAERSPPIGFKVPRDYPPHQRTLAEGLLIMRKGEPGYDDTFERMVGVESTFAAITVGAGNTHVLSFSVNGEIREEQILYSLSAVRHVINLKLEERKLAGIIDEARIIQESLLPRSIPEICGYEVWGRSRPAEVVGGDVYDFLSLPGDVLGVAIADASGHGLPAALLARDVITGLRMTQDEKPDIVRTVRRLNRVIHKAALSSKFVSLFYGEFRPDGKIIYCNAGHNPPLTLRGSSIRELRRGGLILGPNPEAHYVKGHTCLSVGDAVVLYTDGIVELENSRGLRFGLARLKRLLRDLRGHSARQTAEAILDAADRFSQTARQEDDMTVVVIRKQN